MNISKIQCRWLFGLLIAHATVASGESFVGNIIGTVSGTLTAADGRQVAPQAGPPNVDVQVTTEGSSVTARVTGSAACTGGLGVYFNFSADYDSSTGALSGTYTDNDGIARPILFSQQSGLNWQARIQGTAPSSTGARSYDLTVDLALPAEALYAGQQFPANTQFGDSQTVTTSIPITIPAISAIGYAGTTTTVNMTTNMTWSANVVPSGGGTQISGDVSGTFTSDAPISIPVSIPGLPVSDSTVAINGRFGGTLSGNVAQNTLQFVGNWSAGDANYGGDMEMSIPIDASGNFPAEVPLRITGSIQPAVPSLPPGSPSISIPTVPLDITVQIPFQVRAQ